MTMESGDSTATKLYPDQTLERALAKRGYTVRCHWQMKGPKGTHIAWMEYLWASSPDGTGSMIVQTFKDGGWNVFVEPTHRNDIDMTVSAVVDLLQKK